MVFRRYEKQRTRLENEIHDINGRFIQAIDLSNMNDAEAIDLSQVASGLYFMTISSDNAKSVVKLMKQ